MSHKFVSVVGKNLLKNSIQSTNFANKKLEENLMWEAKEKLKSNESFYSNEDNTNRSHKRNRSANYSDRESDLKRNRSAEYSPRESNHKYNPPGEYSQRETNHKLKEDRQGRSKSESRNYWTKKLLEEEDKHSDRWKHTGFKELYPDEIQSGSSQTSNSSSETQKKKKKCKKCKKSKKKKCKKKCKKCKKFKHKDS